MKLSRGWGTRFCGWVELCLAEEGEVPGEELGAEEGGGQASEGEEAAEGEAGFAVGAATEEHESDGVERAGQHSEKEREQSGAQTEEGGDHGQHLHIAEAHAVTMAQKAVEGADDPEEKRGGEDGKDAEEQDAFGAGEYDLAAIHGEQEGADGAEQEADGGTAESEFVREEPGLPIHDEQADGEEAEGRTVDGSEREAE